MREFNFAFVDVDNCAARSEGANLQARSFEQAVEIVDDVEFKRVPLTPAITSAVAPENYCR